jgi:predicted HicB family RNase H-like nuclease
MEGIVLSQIRLPLGLHKKLRRKADDEQTSLNKTMIALIEAGLEKEDIAEEH